MTSKQIKRTPISIFFSNDQIPKDYKKNTFEEYSSYSIYKSEEKILINLSKISHLNSLQKNYKLLLIGRQLRIFVSLEIFYRLFWCKNRNKKFF